MLLMLVALKAAKKNVALVLGRNLYRLGGYYRFCFLPSKRGSCLLPLSLSLPLSPLSLSVETKQFICIVAYWLWFT
jgi:hypothetical protein